MSVTSNRYGIYKLRFRVNKKLQPYFKKQEVNKSLYTRDYSEAQERSVIITKKYKELLKVSKLLDKEQIQKLVNKFIKEELEQDLEDRVATGTGSVFTSSSEYYSSQELTLQAIGELKSNHLEELSTANYSSIKGLVSCMLEEASLEVDESSKNYSLLCYYIMQAQIHILTEVENRTKQILPKSSNEISSKVLKSLVYEPKKEENSSIVISNAVERYLEVYNSKNISNDKKKSTQSILNRMVIILKDVSIDKLKDTDLLQVQKVLCSMPALNRKPYNKMDFQEILKLDFSKIPDNKKISKRTVSDQVDVIKQFFKYCYDNGIIKYNIGSQLGIEKPETTKIPFTRKEVISLINIIKKDKDNHKQILLLSYFYTSFRREELYNSIIEEIDSIPCFKIIKGKNKFAKRVIPIHNDLLEFYNSKGLSNINQINDAFEKAKKTISHMNLGKYFNQKIKTQITDDSNKTLHSTRKTFATLMVKANIEEKLINTLTGHTPKDTMNKIYVHGVYSTRDLKEAIDKLVFNI